MNILLLHTDQQRFDTIAAHGNPHIKTPNIDRLVASGTSFRRAYSSNPICMPARHDLVTGASARHHGYWSNCGRPIQNQALNTLPRMLTLNDYHTVAVGKMHFFPNREHHGFKHMFLMEELPDSREDDAYLQYLERQGYGDLCCEHGVRPLFYHTPQAARVPEEHHGSAWVATKTIELLKTERKDPFFIFSSWVGPHPPYYVPQKYLDIYRDQPVPEPLRNENRSRQIPPSPEDAGPTRLRRMRESYYAAITFIDHQIGRILDALEETGQMDNTLIVFMTDHGEALGDNGTYQKMQPHDCAARIPLIVSGPGFKAGENVDVPAVTWDVSATILKAAGVEPPSDHPMVGRPLSEVADDDGSRIVNFNFADGRERYVTAVSSRYKFIHYYNGGDEELYDMIEDPCESANLIDSAPGDVVGALRESCLRFEIEHGPPESVKDGKFVDFDYKPMDPYRYSLYPLWSYQQFPRWMPSNTPEVAARIAEEMDDSFAHPSSFIHTAPEWRERAMEKWLGVNGDPKVYERLFKEFDRRLKDGEVED